MGFSDYSAQPLIEAFTEASSNEGFGKKYQAQADALDKIISALNGTGTFIATVEQAEQGGARLDITHKGQKQSFAVGFGRDAFSGGKTIKLTTLPGGRPVGTKKDGFNLTCEPDCNAFLKALGSELATGYAEAKAGSELVYHLKRR
jgi:hypothetical protein